MGPDGASSQIGWLELLTPDNKWGTVRMQPFRQNWASALLAPNADSRTSVLTHSCTHADAAGSACPAKRASCPAPCLQICDYWGTFGPKDATTVCKQLGLPLPGRSVGGAYWGTGTGPQVLAWPSVFSEGCQGNETSVNQVRESLQLASSGTTSSSKNALNMWLVGGDAVQGLPEPCLWPAAPSMQCNKGSWGNYEAECQGDWRAGVECGAQPCQLGPQCLRPLRWLDNEWGSNTLLRRGPYILADAALLPTICPTPQYKCASQTRRKMGVQAGWSSTGEGSGAR